MLAYLKTIANGNDDIALLRIINVPKRGIGATTIAKVSEYANENNISLYDAMSISEMAGVGKASDKIKSFITMIEEFREKVAQKANIANLIEELLEETGYIESLYDDISYEASLEKGIFIISLKDRTKKELQTKLNEKYFNAKMVQKDVDRMDENSD